jgi:hypothetical protein
VYEEILLHYPLHPKKNVKMFTLATPSLSQSLVLWQKKHKTRKEDSWVWFHFCHFLLIFG